MTRSHTIQLPRRTLDADKLGFFRWGSVGSKVILTADSGEWHLLTEEDFKSFLSGELDASHPQHAALQAKGFIRDGMDLEALSRKIRKRRGFLGAGPHLICVITTLRCNQSCGYCHASRTSMDKVETDMSLETAKKAVDHAMQSPSPYLCFEYQGGEPTVNFEVIKFCVEYSREKNRQERKTLDHSVVTNMTHMDEEKATWLIDNDVLLCTSLDGPAEVHDKNRPWTGGGAAHAEVVKWMQWFNQHYIDKGRDPDLWHVDALTTTTRASIEHPRQIVDEYVRLGLRNIHIRPLNPFGFATKTWRAIGYTMEEWLAYYEEILDYILELNRQGTQIMEGTASTFLKKLLTEADPNFVDIRSPVGSGTGQICYGFDGSLFPSDEGRMVHGMGDDIFVIGHVDHTTWDEAANHPTVRAIATASYLDAIPQCESCWNAPYCGVRPLHNYMQCGDLFGLRPLTPKCQQHMAMVKMLIRRLDEDTTGDIERIFRRWIVDRPR
jgi:His-Xaa-Ser system radical SAM maturase HxsB